MNGSHGSDDKVFQAAGPDVENARGPYIDVSVLLIFIDRSLCVCRKEPEKSVLQKNLKKLLRWTEDGCGRAAVILSSVQINLQAISSANDRYCFQFLCLKKGYRRLKVMLPITFSDA